MPLPVPPVSGHASESKSIAGKKLLLRAPRAFQNFWGLVSRDGEKKSAAGSFVFLSEKREIEKYLQGTKEQPLSRFVVSRFAQGCSLLIFHPIHSFLFSIITVATVVVCVRQWA
jgi:hypothetical protein